MKNLLSIFFIVIAQVGLGQESVKMPVINAIVKYGEPDLINIYGVKDDVVFYEWKYGMDTVLLVSEDSVINQIFNYRDSFPSSINSGGTVNLIKDSINKLSAKMIGVWSRKINLIETIYIKYLPNGEYYFDFSENIDSSSMSGKWRVKESNIIEYYNINIHREKDIIEIVETEEEKNRSLKYKIEEVNEDKLVLINIETNEKIIHKRVY